MITNGQFVVDRCQKFYKAEKETTLQLSEQGRVEVVLTTFETAREHIGDVNRVDWKTVIVDECHRIKDAKASITIALKSLRKYHDSKT